jgi:hypothetical protein
MWLACWCSSSIQIALLHTALSAVTPSAITLYLESCRFHGLMGCHIWHITSFCSYYLDATFCTYTIYIPENHPCRSLSCTLPSLWKSETICINRVKFSNFFSQLMACKHAMPQPVRLCVRRSKDSPTASRSCRSA